MKIEIAAASFIADLLKYPESLKYNNVSKRLMKLKNRYIKENDEEGANLIWCIEQAYKAQSSYRDALMLIKDRKYYDAWIKLERTEITIHFLIRNLDDGSLKDNILFISNMVKKWQSIYPYRLFISTEIVEEEVRCSICDSIISPFSDCGHRIGELYAGACCIRVVTKGTFLGTAFVQNPVNKYSVPFISDSSSKDSVDHYDYGTLEYLLSHIENIHNSWETEWTTTFIPHEEFMDTSAEEACPCGSLKSYGECCLRKEGVAKRNVCFIFE